LSPSDFSNTRVLCACSSASRPPSSGDELVGIEGVGIAWIRDGASCWKQSRTCGPLSRHLARLFLGGHIAA
jgi:hypothetical protein